MAFLPRPCITKEQLADLSNHLHTLSYFWGGKKHWSKFRKSNRALWGNTLCTHPTVSPHKLSMDQGSSAEQKDVGVVGPVCRLQRRDTAGSLVQLPPSCWSEAASFTYSGPSTLLDCTVRAETG